MDLNNEVILLRKSLRSIVNQTKLNLIKKVKQGKKLGKNVSKKEDELNCFKRLSIPDIPLSHGLHPDKLQKTLTDRNASEIDRVYSRILQSPIIQRTLIKMKEAKGPEVTEKFLERNQKNIKHSVTKKIDQEVKEKIQKSESKPDKKSKKKEPKTKAVKPGAFVRNPDFKGSISSGDESDKDDIDSAPRAEDPFFISTTGTNYLATISTAVSESSEDDDDDHPPPPKKQFRQTKPRNEIQRGKQHDLKKPIKVYEKPIFKPQVQVNEPVSKEEDIHPSWAAKQKQKMQQNQEFKGTKIKFDD